MCSVIRGFAALQTGIYKVMAQKSEPMWTNNSTGERMTPLQNTLRLTGAVALNKKKVVRGKIITALTAPDIVKSLIVPIESIVLWQ